MTDPTPGPRFRVSNLGHAFAVHDTAVHASYAFPAGREKKHPSTNACNTRIVEIVPTRAEAQRIADELNRSGEGSSGAA